MSEVEKEFSRRDLLRSSALVAAPLLVGSALPLQAQSPYYLNNPFPSIPSVCGIAHSLYVSAFRRDVSTGWTGPALDPNLIKNFINIIGNFNQDAANLGALGLGWNTNGLPNLSYVNPYWMTYQVNKFQCGFLNRYFFELADFSSVITDMNTGWTDVYAGNGQSAIAVVEALQNMMQPYAQGNFTSSLRPQHNLVIPVMFDDDFLKRESNISATAGLVATIGVAIVANAGGFATLTSATASAATFVACWFGVGLIVLGVATLLYVGYREFTKSRMDTATIFTKDNPVLNQEPGGGSVIYPPDFTEGTIPDVHSTITYGHNRHPRPFSVPKLKHA